MDNDTPTLSKVKSMLNKNIVLAIVLFIFGVLVSSVVVLANENRVTVQAEALNVRIGPGLSHGIISQVHKDDRLHVLGEDNQWYKVRLSNDQIGWVASWLVESDEITAENQSYGRVTAPSVNIRQFATAESAVIGTVPENTEVQTLYQENNWYQIIYMGRVAWIHADYIEPIESATITSETLGGESIHEILTLTRTNIRSAPNTDAEIIETVDSGSSFTFLNSENDWYEVQLNDGQTGYVASWVVDLQEVLIGNEDESDSQITQTERTSIAESTIVIDAGHGGQDSGAVSSSGLAESDVTLSTALLLEQRLSDAGANVILTRSEDVYVTLNDRTFISNSSYADAFISIHYDAVPVANSMSGTTTYYYDDSELHLAETINSYLESHGTLPNNGVRHGDYMVLRQNTQPSILLELGYMNNDYDSRLISTETYQANIVEAIYLGLQEYIE